MIFKRLSTTPCEQILYCYDHETQLKAIIAIHSTALGPGIGGCRMWNYRSEEEGLEDVVKLARGMTYKAAISGLKWGGAKAVIFGSAKSQKSHLMLQKFGEYVHTLSGRYFTAKDVGIDSADLKIIKTKTPYVLGIEGDAQSGGDPSPATAWGVYHCLKVASEVVFQKQSLKGLTIAFQGLGSVSYYLLDYLSQEGAKLIGCDIDGDAIERCRKKFAIEIVDPERIYDVECDIFSPSALGGSINPESVHRIKASIVAGAANNQLATSEMGEILHQKGILYAPDYLINAGGLINIYHENAVEGGYQKKRAFDAVQNIARTLEKVFILSQKHEQAPSIIVDRIVEDRLSQQQQTRFAH